MPDMFASLARVLLLGLPTLGLIVFVHELGHFVAARIVGVRVITFSLGFGKRLWGFEHGGTDYRICALPLGGYVKMAGDQIEEEREEAPDEFLSRRWYERAFIAVAGPGANFVMAVICGVLFFATGIQYPLHPNVVGPVAPGSLAASLGMTEGDRITAVDGVDTGYWHDVELALEEAADGERPATLSLAGDGAGREVRVPADGVPVLRDSLLVFISTEIGQVSVGTPAYQGGLQQGDVILAVNDTPVASWYDLTDEVRPRPAEAITLEIEREGGRITRALTTLDSNGIGLIGVEPVRVGTGNQSYGIGEAIPLGVEMTLGVWRQVVTGIGSAFAMMITNPKEATNGLAGPVAIMQISAQQAESGRSDLLYWLMFLSLALLSMNLLPIPVLDGGHIVVALYEGVSRRPISAPVYAVMYRVGLLFLLVLMTLAVAGDGFKVFQRSRAVNAVDEVTAPAPVAPDDDAAPSSGD